MAKYEWGGEEPPEIDAHSKSKHKTLESYLKKYLDVTTRHPSLTEHKWLLVDGFSGGGIYNDSGNIYYGSPFVLLRTTVEHSVWINQERENNINFDFRYIFIEKKKKTYRFLRDEMEKSLLYNSNREKIHTWNKSFSECLPDIVQQAKGFMPKTQKCLIFLDQYGYAGVTVKHCLYLMQHLNKAEIVLIFAVGWLLDYLNSKHIKVIEDIFGGMSPELASKIKYLHSLKETTDNQWKQAIEEDLYQLLFDNLSRRLGRFVFMSKYFIQNDTGSQKSYWFVHICRHSKAREVMQEQFWKDANCFRSYGQHLNMGRGKNDMPLLGGIFSEEFRTKCKEHMKDNLPRIVYEIDSTISKDDLWEKVANHTPILRSDFEFVLNELKKGKDIEIGGDNVVPPPQRKLFIP